MIDRTTTTDDRRSGIRPREDGRFEVFHRLIQLAVVCDVEIDARTVLTALRRAFDMAEPADPQATASTKSEE